MRKNFILSGLIFASVFLAGILSYAQEDRDQQFNHYLDGFYDNEYADAYRAKSYLDSAEKLLPNISDPVLIGNFYLYKGWYFQDISDFNKSRQMFYNALAEYEKVRAYQEIANVYGNLGNAYFDIGELSNSLDYHERSLVLNEKIAIASTDSLSKDAAERGKAYAYTNIAAIYIKLKEYKKSLNYELMSLEYEIARSDSLGIAISYQGIGELYDRLGKKDSALYYLNYSSKLFEKESYSYGLIRSLQGLAELESDSLIARVHLLRGLDLTIENGEAYGQINMLNSIVKGGYSISTSKLLEFVHDIETLQKDTILAESTYGSYQTIADFYFKINNFKKSAEAYRQYLHFQKLDQLRDEKDELKSQMVRHEMQLKSYTDSLKIQTEFAEKSLEDERKISRQKTIITIAVAGGILLLGMTFFLFKSIKTKSDNNRLLNAKNQRIQDQKELVDEKNKQITDSINYAKRLQSAILPPITAVNKEFTDLFILFKPKDVVSGDFFWFEKKNDLIFIAAADCTGHGVPGAMVSVVCSNALNRTVNEFNLTSPSKILDKTREIVVETFARSGEDVKDGMDISVCCINKSTKTILFAGANNPVWICRKSEDVINALGNELSQDGFTLLEFKGDKQPVGLYSAATAFNEISIQYHDHDTFYLFTDGYADQFGGAEGKKLKYKTFKKLLLSLQGNDLEKQADYLDEFIVNWMGSLEQIDDICVIGFKP